MMLFHCIYQAVSFSILWGCIILTRRLSSFFTRSVSLVSIILDIITFPQLNHWWLPIKIIGLLQGSSPWNHYLSWGYQWQFHWIISLLGGYPWEIITYCCISLVVSFNTRQGFQLQNHLVESMIISSRFQMESLVYWVDIHGKSLLTIVISLVVSFNTWQGFQLQNHYLQSWYQWQFHLLLGKDFIAKSLLTVVISMTVSFNPQRGLQLWYHCLVVLGIGISNPGVFHGYPHLYPCPTIWVFTNPGVCSPCMGKVPKQTKTPHNSNASIKWHCCAVLQG